MSDTRVSAERLEERAAMMKIIVSAVRRARKRLTSALLRDAGEEPEIHLEAAMLTVTMSLGLALQEAGLWRDEIDMLADIPPRRRGVIRGNEERPLLPRVGAGREG